MAILGPTTINGNLTITGTLNGYTIGNIISKDVDTEISSDTSTNIPTSKAIADYVNSAISSWKTNNAGKLTVSGKTVTASAGYFASATSASVADGAYSASVSLTAGAGSVTQTVETNELSASESNQGSGTFYKLGIKSTGSGTVSGVGTATIGTAGYISAGSKSSTTSSKTSNTASTTKTYYVPEANFSYDTYLNITSSPTNCTLSSTDTSSGIYIGGVANAYPRFTNTAGFFPAHSTLTSNTISAANKSSLYGGYLTDLQLSKSAVLNSITTGTESGTAKINTVSGSAALRIVNFNANYLVLSTLSSDSTCGIGNNNNKVNITNNNGTLTVTKNNGITNINSSSGEINIKNNTGTVNYKQYAEKEITWSILQDEIGNLIISAS